MSKAKEILHKHTKGNGCRRILLRNPFLEQAVLNAINEALTMPAVVGQSEQLKAVEELVDFARDVTNVCDLDRLEEILDRL